jgi:dTDP-4-dehydrorhamnose 3,5-epimerase-like enzyme
MAHSQSSGGLVVRPFGVLKVALHDTRPDSSTYRETMELFMGDNEPSKVLRIPPGVLTAANASVVRRISFMLPPKFTIRRTKDESPATTQQLDMIG